MAPWNLIGAHSVRVEGDTVFARAKGEITGPEMVELLEVMQPVYKQYGYVLEIIDAGEGGEMSGEARRENALWYQNHEMKVEAFIYGANPMLRAIFRMVSRAIRALSNPQVHVHFVANEEEALALAAKRRTEIQAVLRMKSP